jgi:protein-L-isoaspartate(D-aspartate) O-methyltransferase
MADSHEQFQQTVIKSSTHTDRVRGAFAQIDRALFVPEDSEANPYADETILLKDGSTISQPSLVAFMIEVAGIRKADTVFELGTASGYSAAVASVLADEVITVEVDPELAEMARKNIAKAGRSNVEVLTGDGLVGLPEGRTFHKGVLTAALKGTPQKLLDQLEPGGRIVAPLVPNINNFPDARLTLFDKNEEGEVSVRTVSECQFVPIFSPEEGGFDQADDSILRKAVAMSRRRDWVYRTMAETWGQHGVDRSEAISMIRADITDRLGLDELISEEDAIALAAIGLMAISPTAEEGEFVKEPRVLAS